MNDLQFGDFRIDNARRRLCRGADLIPLPAKAFDLLVYMATHPGRVLSKSELLSTVWPDSIVEDANLSQNIFLLRKALRQKAEDPILTVPGRGYQFTASVAEVPLVSLLPAAGAENMILDASRLRVTYQEEVEEHISVWKSSAALSLLGAGALVTCLAGWLGWQRYEDRVGGAPVQIVMADLDGSTGDAVLDRTLTTVTRSELAQSPFVSLLPGATLRSTLRQMMHKPTDSVTVTLAREACERTGSQAVLHESVAHAGSGFVLTEEATNCADGSSLALVHEEAAKADDLPDAISKANRVIRHGLGESRRTIARFNAPLTATNTPSIEALKDYSQASFLATQGHFFEAIELQKQAIALDPGFAAAYLDLSGYYANTLDLNGSRIALQKAYDLRDSATEPAKLYITARFHTYITGDLYDAVRNYRAWAALYPRQVQPWSGLANVYTRLGQPAEELDAAQHVLQLAPSNLVAYQGLALAQIATGDFSAARSTCQVALSKHFDTESIHYILLRLAYLQHDAALLAKEDDWAKDHPDSPILIANQAAFAIQQGRMREGERLLQAMSDVFAQQGNGSAGLRIQQAESVAFSALGNPDIARRLLHIVPPDPTDNTYIFALAATGDIVTAETLLHEQLLRHPQDTLWDGAYGPITLAQIALLSSHPAEALSALESARKFDRTGADFHYLRGMALLQLKRLPEAENEFRTLLAHPEIEPNGYDLPLAQLQLARTLSAENKGTEAEAAYRAFLALWSNADPGQPLITQAKQELALLR